MRRRWALLPLTAWLFVSGVACGHGASSSKDTDELVEVGERRVMLLGESAEPAFFLGPEPAAPALGFGGRDAKLIILAPSQQGRTRVRVHGRLSVEAYVPDAYFELRAQRHVRLSGTPVLVASDNRVRLLGGADSRGLVPVAARVQVGDLTLGPFEGTVPMEALAANSPTDPGEPLSSGIAYRLQAQTALPLYNAPQGELISLVAPQAQAQTVQVLRMEGLWFSVRLGTGPYLEGFTNAPLVVIGKPLEAPKALAPSSPPRGDVPTQIAEAQGTLKRVPRNTRLTFRGKPLAIFRSDGWARVLSGESGGQVEVLAAADELVTVRAMVASEALLDADEQAVGLPLASSPGIAQQLATAQP